MNLNEFKVELEKVVSKSNIIEDKNRIKEYSQDQHYPLTEEKTPELVITPKSLEDVQKIVKIANEFKVPIIPKSSKTNRYGGTIVSNGGLIIDLRKLNRIISIDDTNMHVVIEPGVTFEQLQSELDNYKLRILPSIFSSSDSIISSYLARYPTYSMPKFEYTDLVVNLEIVLGNGEMFRTGSWASVKSPPVYPYGSSLDFFRIFHGARGGLGIITKASIRVKSKPLLQEIVAVPFSSHDDFVNFVYDVERKEIGTECVILNKVNAMNYLNIEDKAKEFPNWIFLICLEGPQRFPEDKIEYEKEALNRIIEQHSIDQKTNDLVNQLKQKILMEFNKPQNKKKELYDLPIYVTLDKFPEIYSIIQNELTQFKDTQIELGVSIIPVERNRTAYVEFDLHTQLSTEEEITSFKQLFRTLGELAVQTGAIIDIPYGPLKQVIYSRVGNYIALIKEVKNIFDPNNILNPGKIEKEAI
ncbi:MAG: FAD-binding oxidoreductase [Promethearchaeota archaeon]|jgi:hypothetical protein